MSSTVAFNDWGKFGVLLASIVAAGALAALDRVSGEAALGVIIYVSGYVTGNGVLARRRQAPSTVLAPRLGADELDELGET